MPVLYSLASSHALAPSWNQHQSQTDSREMPREHVSALFHLTNVTPQFQRSQQAPEPSFSSDPGGHTSSVSAPYPELHRSHHLFPEASHKGHLSLSSGPFQPQQTSMYQQYAFQPSLNHYQSVPQDSDPPDFGGKGFYAHPQSHWNQHPAEYVPEIPNPLPQPATPSFTRFKEEVFEDAVPEPGVRYWRRHTIDSALSGYGDEVFRSPSHTLDNSRSHPYEVQNDSNSQEDPMKPASPPRRHGSHTEETGNVEKVRSTRASILQRLIMKDPSSMIEEYIMRAPNGRLLLNDIYETFITNFPVLSTTPEKWKLCIRTKLSTENKFGRVARPREVKGRGDYWTVNPEFAGNRPRNRKPWTGSKKEQIVDVRTPSPPASASDCASGPIIEASPILDTLASQVVPHAPGMPELLPRDEILGKVPQTSALDGLVSMTTYLSASGAPFGGHDLEAYPSYPPETSTSISRMDSPLTYFWDKEQSEHCQ